MPGHVPEIVMSLLHSSVVHHMALATFSSQSQQSQQQQQQQQQQAAQLAGGSPPPAGAGALLFPPTASSSSAPQTPATPGDAMPPPPPPSTPPATAAAAAPAEAAATPPSMPLIVHSADRATEFYHRLESLGFTVGLRIAERLLCTQQVSQIPITDRPAEDAVNLLRTVLWPCLFGKELGREGGDNAQQQQQQQQSRTSATSATSAAGGGAAAGPASYRLLDTDFSWVRSVALPPDSPALADPFIRAPHSDVLEDAAEFTAHHEHHQQRHESEGAADKQNDKKTKLTAGPNDHVVFLTGLILGFFSTLGFGSRAEQRVFGGERACVSAMTPAMAGVLMGAPASSTTAAAPPTPTAASSADSSALPQQGSGSSAAAGGGARSGGGAAAANISGVPASLANSVTARAPMTLVTVRHRLLPREGELVRPTGMQLKLVVHFE